MIISVGFKVNNDRTVQFRKWANEILIGPGKITAEEAKLHAETQFEKYRIVQDQLFVSDFDRFLAEPANDSLDQLEDVINMDVE